MWTTLGFPRVYYDACVPYKVWDFIFLKHTRKQDKRSRANKRNGFCFWEYGVKVNVAQSCPTLSDPMVCKFMECSRIRILEWVAFPFFRRSSQPRHQTQVSCIAGGFFTS